MDLVEAQAVAEKALEDHGLKVAGWRFRWDNAKRRFGACRYFRRVISLSRALTAANTAEAVTNTILHEVAHALVGPGEWHGPVWQAKARAIGCDGARCYGSTVITPSRRWLATCPSCGKSWEYYRRRRLACRACCRGVFNTAFLLVWKAI